MGCCGNRASAAVTYPRTVTLPDGSEALVSSASDERSARLRAQERMRAAAAAQKEKGYTVTRR